MAVTDVVDVSIEAGGERPERSSPEETALAPSTNEAGWYPDPLDPTRRRRWDGRGWTARVSSDPGPGLPEQDAIHWAPTLVDAPFPVVAAPEPVVEVPESEPLPLATLPPLATIPSAGWNAAPQPLRLDVPTQPGAGATVVSLAGVERPRRSTPDEAPLAAPTSGAGVDPIRAAFGDDARPAAPELGATRSRGRRPLVAVAIAAAIVLGAGAAVAGAGLLRSNEQRPTVLPELSYRDDQAGFALRYPDDWHVLRRQHGNGIRFAIGAPGAPTTDTNTVSVVVGSDSTPLPQLHTLADQLTETLRAQLPGVRLDSAGRSRLADAPAFRFTFRDPDATPPTRIDQYVGRTTSGKPLTVTVTVREPRTAPTPRELNQFVGSLDPS